MDKQFTTTTEIYTKDNIKLYYEIDETINKVNILDSSENYFNDMYFDPYYNEDIQDILNMITESELKDMCSFFGVNIYTSAKELIEKEELEETEESLLDNEYCNRFESEKQIYYTWSN